MQNVTFKRLLLKNRYMCRAIPNYTLVMDCDVEEIQQILFDVHNYGLLLKLKQEICDSLNEREIWLKDFGLARFIKIRVTISRERKRPFENQYSFDADTKVITFYRLKPIKHIARCIFQVDE